MEYQEQGIAHRLIKPGQPQTNCMVERFNGRISDVLSTQHNTSGEDLAQTLKRYYCWLDNHYLLHKALYHQSPIAAMKEGQAIRMINHTGPNI